LGHNVRKGLLKANALGSRHRLNDDGDFAVTSSLSKSFQARSAAVEIALSPVSVEAADRSHISDRHATGPRCRDATSCRFRTSTSALCHLVFDTLWNSQPAKADESVGDTVAESQAINQPCRRI